MGDFWRYPPKDPHTGRAQDAGHCGELKFLWRLRCNESWVDGRPWAVSQCKFGLRFAAYWRSFAAFGDPREGERVWPPYDARAKAALVIENNMTFSIERGVRATRCDFWDRRF